jgi:hypothetical protein
MLTSLLTAVGMFGNDLLLSAVPLKPSGTEDLGWLWLARRAAIPTKGVCIAPAARGDDEVDDITFLGDVGAEPPLGIWNEKYHVDLGKNQK